MTRIRLVLMLHFFIVVHKAVCQTLSKAFLKSGWAVSRSFGPVREGIRHSRPPRVSQLWVKIAGVSTASLGGYLRSTKTRARWAEGFHDELNGHVFDMKRDGLRQFVYLALDSQRDENKQLCLL